MKLIVLLMLTLPGISGALIRWSQGMLGYLSLDVQVVFVLAIFPVIMNVFQFCVMDQVIKAGKGAEHKEAHDYDEEEMDGYEALPTREHDAPRRASGAASALSRTSSRASSIASLSAPEERGLLERDNVWSALSRQRGSNTDEPPAVGLARRSSRASLRGTDEGLDEPDAVPLSPLSPRISRT